MSRERETRLIQLFSQITSVRERLKLLVSWLDQLSDSWWADAGEYSAGRHSQFGVHFLTQQLIFRLHTQLESLRDRAPRPLDYMYKTFFPSSFLLPATFHLPIFCTFAPSQYRQPFPLLVSCPHIAALLRLIPHALGSGSQDLTPQVSSARSTSYRTHFDTCTSVCISSQSSFACPLEASCSTHIRTNPLNFVPHLR